MHLVVRREQRALVSHLGQPADQAGGWWWAVGVGVGCAQGLQPQQDGGVRFVEGNAPSIRAQLSCQCDSGLRLVTLVRLEHGKRADQSHHQESDEPGYATTPDGGART